MIQNLKMCSILTFFVLNIPETRHGSRARKSKCGGVIFLGKKVPNITITFTIYILKKSI